MSTDEPRQDSGEGQEVVEEGVSLDEFLSADDKQAVAGLEGRESPFSTPVLAAFITRKLIWLFVIQALIFSVVYAVLVLSTVFSFDSDRLQRGTEAILTAVTTILPVTTTLLGVVIGYYFRVKEEGGVEQEESL